MNKLNNWSWNENSLKELTFDEQKSISAGSGVTWGIGFLVGVALGEYVKFIKSTRILLAETGPYPPR